jgi:hypothetical protein
MVDTQQMWEIIWYADHNNKDKIVVKVNYRKTPTLRLINPKHHIYYVISALDMTKSNHLVKTIGYSTFSSMSYTIQSQLPTVIDQLDITNQNPLILWGLQTAHNRECGCYNNLHYAEVCTLYPRVMISSPIGD